MNPERQEAMESKTELTELRNAMFRIFEIRRMEDLGPALERALLSGDNDKLDAFCALAPNLEEDLLQRIWQFHLADRKDKKQDFTPQSLAALLAALTDKGGDLVDLCAGSGAMTIQAWARNPERRFTCYELDGNLIPFLLFNLAIRNMNATVFHGDCLSGRYENVWHVSRSEKYGRVRHEQLRQQPPVQHKVGSGQLRLV